MSSTTTNRSVKLIGMLTIIAGVLMIVAGGATWFMVTTQLKAEHITVAAVTDKNPGRLAGKPVAGPFTAYAQADAINHHALEGANNRTYAQLGDDAKALKAKLAASGLSKEEVAKNPDVLALAATRDSTMNGSFLRASALHLGGRVRCGGSGHGPRSPVRASRPRTDEGVKIRGRHISPSHGWHRGR